MNGIAKFFGHLSTITRHRHLVIAHCAKAGVLFQGLFHDLSKYGPTEFFQGVRYYSGVHSPTEDERTKETLVRFLTQLRDEGEDAMFASIRRWLREKE